MKKAEAKEIAKKTIMSALAAAYYRLENEDYTTEDCELICKYITKYGEAMAKRIGEKYYTT